MIEDVKVTAPEVHKSDSEEHLDAERPIEMEAKAPPRRGRARKLPPRVGTIATSGTGRGTTTSDHQEPDREEILRRYGPSKGQQILDAAAGRRPPFTRPASPREEGTVDTGPVNTRDLHLLPRPISFDLTPDQFFKYWALLSGEELERVKVYPYRLWPVTDVNQPLSEEELDLIRRHEKKPPPRNLGLLKQPLDWKNWQAEVCHRYGAGDYNFKLNDTHPAVRRTICQTAIVGLLRDMDTYPPGVKEDTVVLEDPANESYIRWCRLKGVRLPGDKPSGEEATSMADVRTVEILGKQNEKLLEHALDNKKGNTGDAVTEAIKSVTNLMTGASEKSQQMLVDSINKRAESEDPMKFHQRVMDTAKELYGSQDGKNNGAAAVLESMKMMMGAQEKSNSNLITMLLANQKSLEDRLVRAEERAQKAQDKVMDLQIRPPVPAQVQLDANGQPVPPRTMGQQMGELTTMINGLMKLVETVTARAAAGGAEDRMGPLGRALVAAVENAPNMLYNLAVVRSAGQPNAPQPQPPPNGEMEEEPPPQPAEVTEEQAARNLLTSLEQPLVRALTEGVNGAEFGGRLIMTHGPQVYELIASQSDDALVSFLQNNRAIFGVMQQMPQRAMEFLGEFRDAERARAYYDRLRASTAARQPPPPPPRPAAAPGRAAPKPGTRTVYTPKGPVEVQADTGSQAKTTIDLTPEPERPAPPPAA